MDRLGSSDVALSKPLLEEAPQFHASTSQDLAERGDRNDQQRQEADGCKAASRQCSTLQTTAALLTLQLGWGLWLLPCDFARLGWLPGFGVLITLALSTAYSGSLFTRLYAAVPQSILFGDIGEAAAGKTGRTLVYIAIYSLDASRCIILHLAATQSLYHSLGPLLAQPPPLWQCSIIVGVVVLLLGQIRYLTQLSGFFMAGTAAQMVALAIVVYDLLLNSGPAPQHNGVATDTALVEDPVASLSLTHMLHHSSGGLVLDSFSWAPAAMAVLNMVFAYGGQFAFLELITSMRTPSRFSHAVYLCTAIMSCLYGGFGAVGYWSKGSGIHGIVIFNMTPGRLAQIAAGFIFFQALAQYLVNLNVWTHNLLVLLSRRKARTGGEEDPSWEAETHAKSTGDHASSHWLAATAFVAAYSAVIAVAVPFFCTLVGLVTSLTYLTCAYTLPSWFALRLLGSRLGGLERFWLKSLIPISLLLSVGGFVASVKTYITEASGGEGM